MSSLSLESPTGSERTSPAECPIRPEQLPPELRRAFKMIAFDWDGTAVASRAENAGPVRELIERLLRLGVYVVVITGTNFGNVDRQLSAEIRGPHKRRLYVAVNRGSEVYGFDAESRPVLRWRRVATPEENRLLTEVADAVRDRIVARTGLPIGVIYDRLNRRKIDLIPTPEWSNPPKSAIGELYQAVQARLKGAGLAGGIREVVELTERIAREKGLTDARITSDVKHVEVGLTDKSDSIDWMMRELARKRGIPPKDILIAGDEFGPIAGFEGSDYRMVTPRARGAVYVSVGPEPSGAPPGVVHVGGGPACFRTILADQIALHERDRERGGAPARSAEAPVQPLATPTAEPGWRLVAEGFNPGGEYQVESLFAVGNGYLGTRGSLEEGSAYSSSATFVAGVFGVAPEPGAQPELVKMPEWPRLRVFVDGQELRLDEGEILDHRRILDLRQGILWREWRHQDPSGRVTRLCYLRLVSLGDRHALLQSVTITPENYTGRVRVEGRIEPPGVSPGEAPTAGPRLVPVPAVPRDAGARVRPRVGVAELRAPRSTGRPPETADITVAFASTGRLRCEPGRRVVRKAERGEGRLVDAWEWEAEIGTTYRLDRLVTVYTSRDPAHPRCAGVERPAEAAAKHLAKLLRKGAEGVVEAHTRAWERRWQSSGVEVVGDEAAQQALRFAVYHLICAANPDDERVSVGARALTGEAYKGHIFWDAEIYMLPFYTYADPPTARALLMYRYHTLPAAREKARSFGYRGALYAWESADTGEETTPPIAVTPEGEVIRILSGVMEHHISADVAYAVWQYWQATGDDGFFLEAGAEILLETARFWAGRGQFEADGRYHILRVIGPDEYHEEVDDDAYTNGMARWNLEQGAETARLLRTRWPARWRELEERLRIGPEEPEEWLWLAEATYTGFDPKTKVFEQFRGYFALEEIDLAAYEPRTVPMDVVLGQERVRQSKIVKQPDVIMLIYLLWDRFPREVREANFRYYEPRTGHGSSLSPSIFALVAARLGHLKLAERFFQQAAEIDLGNRMGNSAGGVHAGALGGLWQAAIFGLAGLRAHPTGLAFGPHLLPGWQSLRFPLRWRRQPLRVTASGTPPTVEVRLAGEGAVPVQAGYGPEAVVGSGQRWLATRENHRWGPWREARTDGERSRGRVAVSKGDGGGGSRE